MGIFSRTTKDAAKKTATKAPKTEPKVENAEKKAEAKTVGAVATKADRSSYLLLSPRVSEKAAHLAATGTYVFNVPVTAEKVEIRKAIEALYGVTVERVNTVRGIGKVVRRGRVAGRRNNWKKAIVTLKSGQKIDLYQGV